MFREIKLSDGRTIRVPIPKAVAKRVELRKPAQRSGRKRSKGEDIPITRNLVFAVYDESTSQVHFCRGVGRTEQLVEKLLAAGHKLRKLKTSDGKDTFRRLVVGPQISFDFSFSPNHLWTSARFHGDVERETVHIDRPNGLYWIRLKRYRKPVEDDEGEFDYNGPGGWWSAQAAKAVKQRQNLTRLGYIEPIEIDPERFRQFLVGCGVALFNKDGLEYELMEAARKVLARHSIVQYAGHPELFGYSNEWVARTAWAALLHRCPGSWFGGIPAWSEEGYEITTA